MKFDNRFYLIIVGTIILYISFLIISDLNTIYNKILEMKIEFLPYVLFLAPLSWIVVFLRWHLLLKNSDIIIPKKENFKIYMSGFAMSATPGKVGELIKIQMLHSKYGIPRKKTAPIIISEQFYNIFGILVVSILGLFYFDFSIYVVFVTGCILFCTFLLLSSEKLFRKFTTLISKIKFFQKFVPSLSDSYLILQKSTRGKIFVTSSALSVIFWMLESLIAFLVLFSFDAKIFEFLQIAATYTTSIIIGVASFLPMGIGVVEGSLVGFLTMHGIEFNLATALVVFIRLFTRWIAVSVGFIALKFTNNFTNFSKDKNEL